MTKNQQIVKKNFIFTFFTFFYIKHFFFVEMNHFGFDPRFLTNFRD